MRSRFDVSSRVHDESWNIFPLHVVYGMRGSVGLPEVKVNGQEHNNGLLLEYQSNTFEMVVSIILGED